MADDSIPRLPSAMIEKAPKANLPKADRVAAAKKHPWTLFESACYSLDYEPFEPSPPHSRLAPLLTDKDGTSTDLGIVYVLLGDTVHTDHIEPYSVILWASVSGLPALGCPGPNCSYNPSYNPEEYLLHLRGELLPDTISEEDEPTGNQDLKVFTMHQATSHCSGTPLPRRRRGKRGNLENAPMDEYYKLRYDDDVSTTLFAFWFFRIDYAIQNGDLPATYEDDDKDLPKITKADLDEWARGQRDIEEWDQPLGLSEQVLLEHVLGIPAPDGKVEAGKVRKDLKLAKDHREARIQGGKGKAYSPEKKVKMVDNYWREFTDCRANSLSDFGAPIVVSPYVSILYFST